MPKLANRDGGQAGIRSLILAASAFAVAMMLVGTMTQAVALESKSVLDGMAACYKWCDQHNPPGNSRNVCKNNCKKYWYCHGSDAWKYMLNCKHYSGQSLTVQPNPQTTPQTTVSPNGPQLQQAPQ